MATTFLEPGGDANFNAALTSAGGFWSALDGTPAIATDFVHGSHIKSFKSGDTGTQAASTAAGVCADAGTRISFYIYIKTIPASFSDAFWRVTNSGTSNILVCKITTGGIVQMFDGSATQIGGDGPTLTAGVWYRLSLAYTITSTTINRFEMFLDGVSKLSVTNATLSATGTSKLKIGSEGNGGAYRFSDIYVDDSSALTDPGNIWVTAKRPNANGTANNFGVQIGSGGSGYGSGHSPQVNERALSTTNGWSVVAVAATTEEYNIESKSTGDIDISTATIVDYVGWVDASSVTSETASIIVNNATSNISLTSAATLFTKVAGSSTYPAGTGTDIGVVSDATATTVGLYECGVIVAYIPASGAVNTINNLNLLGVG